MRRSTYSFKCARWTEQLRIRNRLLPGACFRHAGQPAALVVIMSVGRVMFGTSARMSAQAMVFMKPS
jgi:hypothetical protein